MWLLATEAPAEVAIQMQINQRGEQSGSVFDVRYKELPKKSKPVVVAKLSGHPSGQFQTNTLQHAMLRIEGVGMEGVQNGDRIALRVFVNLPSADEGTPVTVPQYAGDLSAVYTELSKTGLLRDITAVVAQVHDTGRPINLNLVTPDGRNFWAEGAYLTLFNEA